MRTALFLLLAVSAERAIPAQADDPGNIGLSPAWEVLIPDTSAPYLVGTGDGFVVATPSGRVRAHGADGSGPLWEADLSARIISAPVFLSDRLALPLEGGDIAILRSEDGSIVSHIPASAGERPQRDPLLSGISAGFVITRDETKVLLLDPATGAILWSSDLPAPPSTQGTQCGSHLLIGTAEGTLASIDPGDGRVRWNRPVAKESLTTAPGCWRKRAYVGSSDNRLYAVRLKRKRIGRLWSFLTGGDVAGRPIVHGDRIHMLSYDTYLYALEADNGHLAWRVRLGRRPRPGGVLHDDRLVVAPLNTERLEIFELPAGTQGAPRSLPDGKERFVSPPIRAGRLIVIAAARYGEETSRIIGLDAAPSERLQDESGSGP